MWLAGVQHYNEIKSISICEFLPPHLAIYIDLPAEEVQKKLKQSGKVVRHSQKSQDSIIFLGRCNPVKTFQYHSLTFSGRHIFHLQLKQQGGKTPQRAGCADSK